MYVPTSEVDAQVRRKSNDDRFLFYGFFESTVRSVKSKLYIELWQSFRILRMYLIFPALRQNYIFPFTWYDHD